MGFVIEQQAASDQVMHGLATPFLHKGEPIALPDRVRVKRQLTLAEAWERAKRHRSGN
jgi:hypothetical protein